MSELQIPDEVVEAAERAVKPYTTRIVRDPEGGAIVVGKHTTPQELARRALTAAFEAMGMTVESDEGLAQQNRGTRYVTPWRRRS